MTVVLFVFEGLCLLGMIYCVAMLGRNRRVNAYRMDLLNAISAVNRREINSGDGDTWRQRYAWFESVSYRDMLNKFWRPLDSFYPDREEWL